MTRTWAVVDALPNGSEHRGEVLRLVVRRQQDDGGIFSQHPDKGYTPGELVLRTAAFPPGGF